MNKLLGLLWILILAGTVFITIKVFTPDTSVDESAPINFEESTSTIDREPSTTTTPTKTEEEDTTEQDSLEEIDEEEAKTYIEYLESGDAHFENRYFDTAISEYQKAANLNPNSTTPLKKLAEAYLDNNQPKEAEKAFKQAEILKPDSTEIQIGIARSLLDQRNIEGAKDLIWSLDQENPMVLYYKAIILILYQDFEGSKILFTKLKNAESGVNSWIVEKSQIFVDAYENYSVFRETEIEFLETLLAQVLTDVEEYQAAIPLLFEVINEKNNYRDAWIVLGYAYLNTEQTLDAIDAFKQALALDDEKPQTNFFLGLAYFANNEIDKAIYYLEQAEKFGYEPKDDLDLKLGDLYLLKEDYDKSANSYEDVLTLNTSNMNVFIRAIWLNIDKLDKPEKALELAYLAEDSFPEDPMSYNLLGWALISNQKYTDAKKYLETALDINPYFDAAHLNLGWLYEKQNLNILAKQYYHLAYELGNNNSISNIAAKRYNNLIDQELKKYYTQVNVAQP